MATAVSGAAVTANGFVYCRCIVLCKVEVGAVDFWWRWTMEQRGTGNQTIAVTNTVAVAFAVTVAITIVVAFAVAVAIAIVIAVTNSIAVAIDIALTVKPLPSP